MSRKSKKRIEKIQKHKGYWKVIRKFREIYGEDKDGWECKYYLKDFRGTREDDLREIKSMIWSKRSDFYREVSKCDSSENYDFYAEGLIEKLQWILKLEEVKSLIARTDTYLGLEQEFQIEIPIKSNHTIKDIQYYIEQQGKDLREKGYIVSKTIIISPNGENKLTFFDELGWSHNKGATSFKILYR